MLRRIVSGLEVVTSLVFVVLPIRWVITQNSWFEPYTVICGLVSGGLKWYKRRLDRNELESVKGQIKTPENEQTVAPKHCPVTGNIEGYNEQALFLFTGEDNNRYWPSKRIRPNPEGDWSGAVNLGDKRTYGIIRLAIEDSNTAAYIELYHNQANNMVHNGIVIRKFHKILDKIKVNIDLEQKQYEIFYYF